MRKIINLVKQYGEACRKSGYANDVAAQSYQQGIAEQLLERIKEALRKTKRSDTCKNLLDKHPEM